MTKRIKLFLLALILLATITSSRLVDFFWKDTLEPAQGDLLSTVLRNLTNDSDQDGLGDTEESLWETDFQNPDTDGDGFLDGEEVASKHDPRTPGPNDKILDSSSPQNVTNKIAGLIVGGFSEGSLKSDSPQQNKAIGQLAEELENQSKINSAAAVKIDFTFSTTDDSSANIQKYANQISPEITEIAGKLPKNYRDILIKLNWSNTFLQRIDQEISTVHEHINILQQMSVPQSWSSKHTVFISLLGKIEANYILLKSGKEDSFQAVAAIADLTDAMITELPNLMYGYSKIYVH
jgi:hypothetical protein